MSFDHYNYLAALEKKRLHCVIIFMSVFCLIFDNIPRILQLTTISNGLSTKLTWYFLFTLMLLYLYKFKRDHIIAERDEFRTFYCYVSFLMITLLLSNVCGLISYPYYEELLSGPSKQIEKLPMVLSFLNSYGIPIDQKQLTMIWISVRSIKGVILGTLYTLGFSFILYRFFKKDVDFYYGLISKAVLASIIVLCLYSSVEILYLAGSGIAQHILTVINPMIHPIAVDHGWWPPLLWNGQLRSMFSEPSRMGNYLAFAMPFLWGKYLLSETRKTGLLLLILFYTFMIFLTKARTAVAMYWGILFLLFIGVLYIHEKQLIKKFLCICGVTIVALALSLAFINFGMHKGESKDKITISSYMEDNVASLGSSNKRSNGARYALIRANMVTGIEHPIIGVGNVLGSAYTVHNFNESDLANREVRMWVTNYSKQGPLRYGLDAMNEYVSRFAANGIIGLIAFVFPFLFAVFKLIQKLRATTGNVQLKILLTLISLIGSAVAGCNGSLTILYSYWIILAYAYSILYGTKLR